MSDFNAGIIEKFRANAGVVGAPFEGRPMLLLHSVGAKTGTAYVTPLVYLPDGERFIVFASKGGAPTNPAWYHNLIANPRTVIEVGTETVAVTASELTGLERDTIYARQAALFSSFADYEQKTSRVIPVIALTPTS